MWCIKLLNNVGQATIPAQATGRAISLTELLASRDNRQARQQQWLKQHRVTLLVLTVVMPGPIKDSALTRRIFNAGWTQIQQAGQPLAGHFLRADAFALATGCEGFWSIQADAKEVKQWAVARESDSPVGRLWDIDVLTTDGCILSRRTSQLAERQCLLCSLPASVCARQRTHSQAELLAEIIRRADAACTL